jgi:(R,R)-butanediol dehydrogenase/meso-butanediol dehydrogenase/diacetyl reductase
VKAVRLTGARALSVESLGVPSVGDGEVLVRVHACGICGSDLSCYKHGIFAGVVPGHELSGTVASSSVESWEEGAHVVVDPKIPCGVCASCVAGDEQLCVVGMTSGLGQARDGGFAEYVLAPASSLYRVPMELDLTVAALAEPAAVVLHGLARASAGAEPCVVFGLGPIGLLTVWALAARGADPIVGIDPVAERRALGLRVGATSVVAPEDVGSSDASLVVETSGNSAAIASATTCGRAGARVLLLGVAMEAATVHPMAWVTRETTIMGSVAHTATDWRDALASLAARPAIGAIITDRIGLEAVPEAFERLIARADAGKILVCP